MRNSIITSSKLKVKKLKEN